MGKEKANAILREILTGRGIAGEAAVAEFLSPRPRLTHDPLLLPDMEAGADFLLSAAREGRRICIYGDYDADGVLGTALLWLFLKELGGDVSYYIPSRTFEGYGLNTGALQKLRDQGAEVVVTVDCGSVSVDEVSFAKSIGLEIMITDHHEPGETLPDCILINPKRRISAGAEGADSAENTAGAGNGSESAENSAESRGYPFAGLCGCAVAFKLACAMFDRAAIKTKGSREVLHQLVDLAAIATIADIMPLCDENRTFVKYGLDLIRKRKRKALAVLLESMGTEPAGVSAKEVSFGVAPRINAVGRLGNASEAVEFFITKDEVRMREIAARMNASNKERRQLQDACYRSCMEICEEDTDGEGRPAHRFLLLRPAVFHEGISGIVAGQIREKTGLPCAVFADSGDCLKASARSVGHLDMIALLRRHEQLLLRVGGHAMAAGFMIRKEDETPLREALNRDLDGLLAADPRLLEEREPADAALDPADVDIALAEALGVMAPFGAGNPKPRVELNIRAGDISRLYYLGEGAHARFSISGIPCIFFRGAEALSRAMEAGGKIRVIGCPEINTWNGKRGLQFVVNCCIGVAG